MQLYVIKFIRDLQQVGVKFIRDLQQVGVKFIRDLQQVGGFLQFPPLIKLTATI